MRSSSGQVTISKKYKSSQDCVITNMKMDDGIYGVATLPDIDLYLIREFILKKVRMED